MPDTLISLLAALCFGSLLSVVYFGGLWLTVRQVPRSSHPELLVMLSFFGRLAVVLAGFFLLTQGAWPWMLAGLLGFTLTRLVIVQRIKPTRTETTIKQAEP